MRNIGIIMMVVGLIITIVGIRASCAIHSYNMANPSGTHQNDLFSILVGIVGFIILFIGWVFFVRPMRKRPKPSA